MPTPLGGSGLLRGGVSPRDTKQPFGLRVDGGGSGGGGGGGHGGEHVVPPPEVVREFKVFPRELLGGDMDLARSGVLSRNCPSGSCTLRVGVGLSRCNSPVG